MSQTNKNIDIFGRGKRGTRHKMIACEIAYRELCLAAAVSRNIIDLQFMTQGLHDLQSATMCARIQAEVDAVPEGRYQAILLGFGLCNCGLVGLRARGLPLVVPRAHDCITLFLGSKEEYQRRLGANGGTFFLTTGWMERDGDNLESTRDDADNVMRQMGLDKSYEEYAALYGEEYARMIMQTMSGGLEHYERLTHIDMGVAPEIEERVREQSEAEAQKRGWLYERTKGRMDLLLGLVNGTWGAWDEEKYLVVRPGQEIQQAYDEQVVRAVDSRFPS
jgi:hypothetical protein